MPTRPCYVGPCHHRMLCPWVVDGGDGLQIWRVAAYVLDKQLLTADKVCYSSLGVEQVADNSLLENYQHITKCYTGPWTWTESFEWPRQQKMDVRFRMLEVCIGQVH
jgi:hypothetical protein